MNAQLSPTGRIESIAHLREHEVDVLVVGGGITGAGIALDAVTRGLTTGIVEARDWGFGTSSRSSKLVHGGIRYLEQLNFSLVREALIERGLLLRRIAPHLVRPVQFLYPLTTPIFERIYIGAGMMLYDLFARSGRQSPGVPWHRHIGKRQLAREVPGLRAGAFRGGIVYSDAQVDDARYVSTLVRTARSYGAHAANRVRVEGFIREGERVVGVNARDLVSGNTFTIRAKQVVNATGVWTSDVQELVGERATFSVRASKGIHLVVPRDRFRSQYGLLLRTEKSVLFVIPWGRHWLIGTTDTDWELDKAHPAATATDIQYLLDHINRVLRTKLSHEDVEGVFAGLRPLLAGESDESSQLSREHLVAQPVPGLVMVAGGKLTTYRVMAKDAVDAVADTIDGRVPASITADIPLLGAEGHRAAWHRRSRTARASNLHKSRIEHLLKRYGALSDEVLELVRQRPELGDPLPGADDYLSAEIVYAVEFEGALHLDDVLSRRTRVSFETWDRGVKAAPHAAELMGEILGWSAEQREAEISKYVATIEAEFASQREHTDEAADRVRLGAPDSAD